MGPLTFDPIFAGAVWAVFTEWRGLVPATWWSIDGKYKVWALVVVTAAIMALYQGTGSMLMPHGLLQGYYPNTLPLVAHWLLWSVLEASGAVIVDGGAAYSGLKTEARKIATLGGKTNPIGAAVEQLPDAPAVEPEQPLAPQPGVPVIPKSPIDIAEDVEELTQAYLRVQAALHGPAAPVQADK